MARYIFDVHNANVPAWDGDGIECSCRSDVENHVRTLADEFADKHDGGKSPVAVMVFDKRNNIVLIATVLAADDVRFSWI